MKKLILMVVVLSGAMFAGSGVGVKPVSNQLYINECGSCHFAFQPGLLPQRSWTKMMGDLANHFGTDASLNKADTATLLAYMTLNASDKSMNYKRSQRMTNSINTSNTPLKISEVPYFKSKHRELSRAMITQKEVGSITNCVACHSNASKGDYHGTYVPNYGRVDD
jgi:hypothetical protein